MATRGDDQWILVHDRDITLVCQDGTEALGSITAYIWGQRPVGNIAQGRAAGVTSFYGQHAKPSLDATMESWRPQPSLQVPP